MSWSCFYSLETVFLNHSPRTSVPFWYCIVGTWLRPAYTKPVLINCHVQPAIPCLFAPSGFILQCLSCLLNEYPGMILTTPMASSYLQFKKPKTVCVFGVWFCSGYQPAVAHSFNFIVFHIIINSLFVRTFLFCLHPCLIFLCLSIIHVERWTLIIAGFVIIQ